MKSPGLVSRVYKTNMIMKYSEYSVKKVETGGMKLPYEYTKCSSLDGKG